jgi:hypothetical protein
VLWYSGSATREFSPTDKNHTQILLAGWPELLVSVVMHQGRQYNTSPRPLLAVADDTTPWCRDPGEDGGICSARADREHCQREVRRSGIDRSARSFTCRPRAKARFSSGS